MKLVSGKQLCEALERNGWILLRINANHHIYKGERGHPVLLFETNGIVADRSGRRWVVPGYAPGCRMISPESLIVYGSPGPRLRETKDVVYHSNRTGRGGTPDQSNVAAVGPRHDDHHAVPMTRTSRTASTTSRYHHEAIQLQDTALR